MVKAVIDPGHGGSDPGAVGPSGLREADVNLAIAQHVARYLLSSGVEIILTRASDVDVSLEERVNIANQAEANVFVSVHCNASVSPEARGAETYYHDESARGQSLAQHIQGNIAALGLYDRGVKSDYTLYQSGLYVLRETVMPAALVEVEFISNPDGEQWLASPDNQNAAGKAIAKGVCEYLGVPFMEEKPKPSFPGGSGSSSSNGSSGSNKPSDWAEKSWMKAVKKGVFDGTEPKGTVTREMLAVVLDRLGLLN